MANVSLSWKQAVDYCNDLNSDLVSISSAAEQDFVFNMKPKEKSGKMWIGLVRKPAVEPTSGGEPGHDISWTDGSSVSFLNSNNLKNTCNSTCCYYYMDSDAIWELTACNTTKIFYFATMCSARKRNVDQKMIDDSVAHLLKRQLPRATALSGPKSNLSSAHEDVLKLIFLLENFKVDAEQGSDTYVHLALIVLVIMSYIAIGLTVYKVSNQKRCYRLDNTGPSARL
ncbi:hypothetical protein HDE_12727 [Halotydeus destructor]|nr:hypothetical protein HDE_12727 [Halotydeus destructor]